MTVREFLMTKTHTRELCVLRDSGYIVATAWIDYEDLFAIPQRIAKQEVKKDKWGTLTIETEHGDEVKIPCHYIDF